MVRCSFLSEPPLSRNSTASQSSNSGLVGDEPLRPKSLGVLTRPRPKCDCQTRLAMERHVSGLYLLAIHSARAARRGPSLSLSLKFGSRPLTQDRPPAVTLSPGCSTSPRFNT